MINKGATAPPFGELKMKIRIEYTVEVDATKVQQYLDDLDDGESVREFLPRHMIDIGLDQINQMFVDTGVTNIEDDQVVTLVEKGD